MSSTMSSRPTVVMAPRVDREMGFFVQEYVQEYNFTAVEFDYDIKSLRIVGDPDLNSFRDYLGVPQSTEFDGMKALTLEIVGDEAIPYEKAISILEYLKGNFTYELNPAPPPSGADPVSHFLDSSGVGMCTLMQGSSVPEVDMGAASLKINEDGSFNLLVGATDLGTGSDTVLAQIAAEVLAVETGQIVVLSSDTDVTPFDVGAYASSTTYLSGMAVKKAAAGVRHQILAVGAKLLETPLEELQLTAGHVVGGDGRSKSFAEIALHSLYA